MWLNLPPFENINWEVTSGANDTELHCVTSLEVTLLGIRHKLSNITSPTVVLSPFIFAKKDKSSQQGMTY